MTDAAVLTQRHRAQQLLLRQSTIRQLGTLWPALNWARLDATYPTFATSVGRLVSTNRQMSMGLASQYLRAFRRAHGIPGEVKAVFAAPMPPEQLGVSLRTTSVATIKTAASRGVPAAEAMANALTLASGSMARLVLNAGRETVVQTIQADPRAVGYERVLGGGGCDFCQTLAGRGAVYGAESADFEAHDRCGCSAQPVYA